MSKQEKACEFRHNIEWRKWIDPVKTMLDTYNRQKDDVFDKGDFGDLKEYQGPVIMTPHGVIPINESSVPSAIFNFWRGDTNFWMTKRVEFIINTTLGVESFDLITPLRFRMAIGTCFNEEDVKFRVKEGVLKYINEYYELNNKYKPTVDLDILRKQYPFFAIINNNIKQIVHGNTKEEVLQKISDMKPDISIRIQYSWI